METRREVRVIQVDKQCPKCHKGFLRPTGIVCNANPPVRPHKCNNPECDYGMAVRGNAYPYLEYEPVSDDIQLISKGMVEIIHGRGDREFQVDVNRVITTEPILIKEDESEPQAINNYVCRPSGK